MLGLPLTDADWHGHNILCGCPHPLFEYQGFHQLIQCFSSKIKHVMALQYMNKNNKVTDYL